MHTSLRFSGALLAASLLVASGSVNAQPLQGEGRGVFLGLFAPFHGFARDGVFERNGAEPGTLLMGGLRLGYDFSSSLGLEAEVGLIPSPEVLVLPWRVNGLVYGGSWGPVRPFIVGGAGALTGLSGVQETTVELHAGLGLLWNVTRNLGVRVEGRGVALAGNANAQNPDWEALLGLAWKFGGASPQKLVEPVRALSEAAKPAEPAKPVDTDADGIADASDRCPAEAGLTENEGCPDRDGDGDGVADRLDQCKEQQGLAEDQGCPPKDSDSDGLADRGDKCPADPETKNSYQDADGCPDEVPQQLQAFTGAIEGIQFQTGSAQLMPASKTLLQKAATTLKGHPELKVTIAGHTDNVGDAQRNEELSKARAAAVMDYLIQAGVEAARLSSAGYGPNRPVADNATAEGRQKNRRVEFELGQ